MNINIEFIELVDNYLNWKYMFYPNFASYLGLSSYDKYTRSFSKDAILDGIDKLHKFRSQTERYFFEDLDYDNNIDRVLLLRDINLLLINLEKICSWKNNPQIYIDEALESIHVLMLKSFRHPEYTAEMILKRLEKIPLIFKEAKENLLHHPPPVFLEVSLQTASHGIEFFDMVNKNYSSVIPQAKDEFDRLIQKSKKALIDFKDFITRDLSPGHENSFAIGKEHFSLLLKTGYMIDKDVDEILEIGEQSFARISDKLNGLASELDPLKSWFEIYRLLQRENPGLSGILNMYLDYMNKAKEYLIEKDLITIPPGVFLDVEETPGFIRPLIPVAAYVSPGPYDEVQKGVFWVTPLSEEASDKEKERAIGEHNIYTARVTAPHEAYPGHHLQLCLSNLQKSPLRKQTHSDILVEGWGLYCEEMMKEVGFLSGLNMELAQQVDQLMRAARVIIDVRLHTRDMLISEAKDFLSNIVLVSPVTANVEVNRYTMSPTQPLSYMIGQLEILQLREDYKKLKGNSYSLKTFHNEVLKCGSSPIKVIRHMLLGENL